MAKIELLKDQAFSSFDVMKWAVERNRSLNELVNNSIFLHYLQQ